MRQTKQKTRTHVRFFSIALSHWLLHISDRDHTTYRWILLGPIFNCHDYYLQLQNKNISPCNYMYHWTLWYEKDLGYNFVPVVQKQKLANFSQETQEFVAYLFNVMDLDVVAYVTGAASLTVLRPWPLWHGYWSYIWPRQTLDKQFNLFKRTRKRSDSVGVSPMTKAPTPTEKSKHKNTTTKFDYTTIADRLSTVSWVTIATQMHRYLICREYFLWYQPYHLPFLPLKIIFRCSKTFLILKRRTVSNVFAMTDVGTDFL